MNAGDVGLAKHATACEKGINWNEAKIIEEERKAIQKFSRGIYLLYII